MSKLSTEIAGTYGRFALLAPDEPEERWHRFEFDWQHDGTWTAHMDGRLVGVGHEEGTEQ